MNFLRKIFLVIILIFPISNSFGGMVTEVQNLTVAEDAGDGESKNINGVDFNNDGTKMFVLYQQQQDNSTTDPRFVDEYNLSTAFDISTATYAGDSERCELDDGTSGPDFRRIFDLEFTDDGLSFFHTVGNAGNNNLDMQAVYRYDLTSPFDISTCTFANDTVNLNHDDLQNGSNAGAHDGIKKNNRAQGVEINPDGTKLFVLMTDAADGGDAPDRILEYNFSTPFDLTTISLRLDAGIELPNATVSNTMNLEFSADGKRLFVVSHTTPNFVVAQISLDRAYDTSSFNIDGSVNLNNLSKLNQLRTVTFTNNGFRMFIGNDVSDGDPTGDNIFEFNLVCPFNIIAGKCSSITENSGRTGMAEAQVELAKRTINSSTSSALNRLKWIRRNKDKQNLSNQNIKLNFSNNMLSSLKELPITSFKKISTNKNNNDSNKNYFYWSEGSISLGRVGDTKISSAKKVSTNSLTFGLDKFTDDYGIEGFAFRFANDDVDVGNEGSNLDSNTYNITYYSTSPIKDDRKFVDKIFGYGKIRSDITTVLDGKNLTADRTGNQIYGTVKIKDEYIKDNFTFIPSGQFDFGHTILKGYQEAGNGAIIVEDQHVRTKNLRAAMAVVEDIPNEKYSLKRHGKLEYVAELDRSSNFKYTYVSDGSIHFNDTLHTGALHNLNGEIGIDIIFPEHYSVFIIYERNHAFGTGYTDNLYIALGYLPNKETEYAFSLNGSDNLMSKLEIKKNINGYDLSLKLNDDLTNIGDSDEASINLNKVF